MRNALFAVLGVLLILGAWMLYRAPVTRYVVTCDRGSDVRCVLERTGSFAPQRTELPLPTPAVAVVRILDRPRGASRVVLAIESAGRSNFAAEFEGKGADVRADAAAAALNAVLRPRTSQARARITAEPPTLYRRASWFALAVMGLLIVAGFRESNRRAIKAPDAMRAQPG